MNVMEISAPPGATYDGGGSRSAQPVTLPPLSSLVFVLCVSPEALPEAERHWELASVSEHFRQCLSTTQLSFRTYKGVEYLLDDHGKTWKEAPPEYSLFLRSLSLSFEEFAKSLARGGIEGVTGKIQAAVTDWGDHNASRYRGVAQEALRLLVKPVDDAEPKRRLAAEALRWKAAAQEAGQVPWADYEALLRENASMKSQIAFAQQVLGGMGMNEGCKP